MMPDRVSNPGPLTYESGALPTALRGCEKFSSFPRYSMNFHAVKCIYTVFVTSKRRLKGFVLMHCNFLHNLEQRQNVFARVCVEKYNVHGKIYGLLQKAMRFLRYTVWKCIEYQRSNILTRSVRI